MNLPGSIAFVTLFGGLLVGSDLLVSIPQQQQTSLNALTHMMAGQQTVNLVSEQEAILVATNQQRARNHLSLLKQDPRLMQAAQQYAELMAAKDQMSHTLAGLKLSDKANAVGYPFRQLSENIALNTRLDGRSVVVDLWMESKGHRKNLLTKDITDIGIGISGPSKQHRYYYCQLFGAQR